MSSFIVETSSLTAIINFFENDHHPYAGDHRHALGAIGYNVDPSLEHNGDAKRLGQAMSDLNWAAVNARYLKSAVTKHFGNPEKYKHTNAKTPSTIQAIKHLQCWLYQCSEGTCDETPLYKAMEKIVNRLLARVVSDMPEYDAAEWS
jgi:hypothetical protein